MQRNTPKKNLTHTSALSLGTKSNTSVLTWKFLQIFDLAFHHGPGGTPSVAILLLGLELTHISIMHFCILQLHLCIQCVAHVLPLLVPSPLHQPGRGLDREAGTGPSPVAEDAHAA